MRERSYLPTEKQHFLGEKPLIIGERINPTGKKKFKQALKDHDMDYILREAISQQDHGAHILDVNVGLPDIDEVEMMREVVMNLQSITSLPLQIDTVDQQAMEAAMRIYNGKPMVNSVNGKQESMDQVFPLIKKYGGAVVALTIDEDGIPQTVEKRVEIAGKIITEAAKYGIPKKDIVIDVLTMTISSEPEGARITLESLEKSQGDIWSLYGAWSIEYFIRTSIPPGSQFQFLHNGNAERSECRNYQSSVRRYDAFILFLLCIDEL